MSLVCVQSMDLTKIQIYANSSSNSSLKQYCTHPSSQNDLPLLQKIKITETFFEMRSDDEKKIRKKLFLSEFTSGS